MLTVAAPAKVNLHLEVLGRDSDGFHRLETVFQTLEWHDTLTVGLTDQDGVALRCDHPGLSSGPTNLAQRAAEAYRRAAGLRQGVAIDLCKRLPLAGGLGGGSSDAAAVLRALQVLTGQTLAADRLALIAAGLGSDVPFFLIGGTAHGLGRGDQVTPLPDLPAIPVTVLVPPFPSPTPAVYAALTDRERGPRSALGPERWSALLARDPAAVLGNRLEAPACRAVPALAAARDAVAALGQPWILCGSGSTFLVFGHVAPPAGLEAHQTAFRPRERLDCA